MTTVNCVTACSVCGSDFEQKKKTEYEQKRLGQVPMCLICRKQWRIDHAETMRRLTMSKRNTCSCGKKCRGVECGWCRANRKANEKLTVVCKTCGGEFGLARRFWKHYEKIGVLPTCSECRGKVSGDRLHNQTKEERAECLRLSAVSRKGTSYEAVRKQWDVIKADPEKFKTLLAKRKANMDRVWMDMPEVEKNRRVGLLCSSHGKGRSKGNDALKKMMQEEGLYEGFVSEQVFHGYIPDEINHELKIIVEYFGDAYHCNPRDYKDENQFVNLIHKTVGEQWTRDRKRLGVFYQNGYSVVIVWARDFRNSSRKELERIRDEIARKRVLVGSI